MVEENIFTPQANDLFQSSTYGELESDDPSDIIISFPTSRSWIWSSAHHE